MTYNLSTTASRTILSTFAALTLAVALPEASSAKTASDVAIWTINLAKSKFGPESNTLVLERSRQGAMAARQSSNANTAGGSFLVISNGSVYMATDAQAYDAAPGVKRVDYNAWRSMKLVLLGDKVQTNAYCSFRCQQGLADNRSVTLTFASKGVTPMTQQIANTIVLDPR